MKSPRAQSKHKVGTSLQVKLPVGVRDEVDAVLSQIGIDMPTAVRIYINKIIQTRSIPFQLAAPEINVEVVEVDEKTQKKMDDVARIWKKHNAPPPLK